MLHAVIFHFARGFVEAASRRGERCGRIRVSSRGFPLEGRVDADLADTNFEAVARGEFFDHAPLLVPERHFRRADAG